MTWDILIATVESRTDRLVLLLEELERQLQPGVTVRVCRDNLQFTQAHKYQTLLDSSTADYVSFIEDDDFIDKNYVALILKAQETDPDFVGFRLYYTEDGVEQLPVVHSLAVKHNELGPDTKVLYRNVTHLNPMRRRIAATQRFDGGCDLDRRWSQGVWTSGLLKSEVFIDEDLYHYRHDNTDSVQSDTVAKAFTSVPPPDFPWVVWVNA